MRLPRRHARSLVTGLSFAACAAFAVAGAPGCAGFSEAGKSVNYSTTARENYEHGLTELKQENWLEAIKFFQFTKAKFGFSKWATLAELGLADAWLGHEKYVEAVDAYRSFIKAHPTHDMVQNGYALYKISDAYYRQIPSEWFLVPPAFEKDMTPVKEALREMSAFAEEYPDSPYMKEARRRIGDCQRRLAEHELYIAEFYLDRGKTSAAVSRLEGLVKTFPHSTLEPDTLLLLGRTYLKMEKPGDAKRTFVRLVDAFPADYHAKKARLYLDYIAGRFGDIAATPEPAAPSRPRSPAAPTTTPPADPTGADQPGQG